MWFLDKLNLRSAYNHTSTLVRSFKKLHLPTPGVLLLLLIEFMLLMWLELATLLGLSVFWSWQAAVLGVLLQPRSWSTRPRESRQRSGLLPTLTRFRLGLFVSADPCLSDAASSSLSMLRLSSCSFSDDASFSLHRKETETFKHMPTCSWVFHLIPGNTYSTCTTSREYNLYSL